MPKAKRGFLRVPIGAQRSGLTEEDLLYFRECARLRAEFLGSRVVHEIGEQHRVMMGVAMRDYVFVMERKEGNA